MRSLALSLSLANIKVITWLQQKVIGIIPIDGYEKGSLQAVADDQRSSTLASLSLVTKKLVADCLKRSLVSFLSLAN